MALAHRTALGARRPRRTTPLLLGVIAALGVLAALVAIELPHYLAIADQHVNKAHVAADYIAAMAGVWCRC